MPDLALTPAQSSSQSSSDIGFVFHLPPEEAIEYFTQKGQKLTWDWWEMWEAAHAKAFTVAKATSLDILSDIRASLDMAMTEGITFDQFRKELQPKLEARGWWGERIIVDESGTARKVKYGTPWRLKTIFNCNVQSSYMAGRYKQMMEVVDTMPYWQYLAVLDEKTRPEHRRWHGRVVRYDDPWWNYYYPPNGWGCRCRVRALTEAQVKRMGLEPTSPEIKFYEWTNKATGEIKEVPVGVDPGWGYNVGEAAWYPDPGGYQPEISDLWDAPKGLPVKKYDDIEPVIRDRLEGYFKRGFKGIEYNRKSYFLATDCNGKISVSGKTWEAKDFNPKQELLSAMKKLGREDLTFNEEYALEGLWHEITHNQEILGVPPSYKYSPRAVLMETMTQFVARHTYPEMLKTLANADAIHQAEIISSGYGYAGWVARFRELVKSIGLDETGIVNDIRRIIQNTPMYDYLEPVSRLLADKSGGSVNAIRNALLNLMG
ncbi:MAG: phage minor head protein [bacterium]